MIEDFLLIYLSVRLFSSGKTRDLSIQIVTLRITELEFQFFLLVVDGDGDLSPELE